MQMHILQQVHVYDLPTPQLPCAPAAFSFPTLHFSFAILLPLSPLFFFHSICYLSPLLSPASSPLTLERISGLGRWQYHISLGGGIRINISLPRHEQLLRQTMAAGVEAAYTASSDGEHTGAFCMTGIMRRACRTLHARHGQPLPVSRSFVLFKAAITFA